MSFSTTAASRKTKKSLALVLEIEGIPYAFCERVATGMSHGDREQIAVVVAVKEGESAVDFEDRLASAPTLDIDLVDTKTLQLQSLFALSTGRASIFDEDLNETDLPSALTFLTTTGFPAIGSHPSGYCYLYAGGETFSYSSIVSGTDVELKYRGEFDSTAQKHWALDSVYTVPPYWEGRRAKLWGYWIDAKGVTSVDDRYQLGAWIIDEAPRLTGPRKWSLRLAGAMQEFLSRNVGVGLQEARRREYTNLVTRDTTQWAVSAGVDSSAGFRLAADYPSFVLCGPRGDTFDFSTVARLLSVPNGTSITFDPRFSFAIDNTMRSPKVADTYKQIAVVGMSSSHSILALLTSTTGQGAHAYDLLPGAESTSTDAAGWRLGAGFDLADVDTASFLARNPRYHAFVVDDEKPLSDYLREYCYLSGSLIVVDNEGKLKAIGAETPRALSTLRTLTAADILPDGLIDANCDESTVYPLVKLSAAYSPLTQDPQLELTLVSGELAKRYRRQPRTLEVGLPSIGCRQTQISFGDFQSRYYYSPADYSIAELQQIAYEIQTTTGNLGSRFVSLSLTLEHFDLALGDVVTISSDLPDAIAQLPDFRGGYLGGSTLRLMSRRPDYDRGRLDCVFQYCDPLLAISPACVVYSRVGTTVTLVATGPEAYSASPTDAFTTGFGQALRFFDVSSGTYELVYIDTILNGTQFTLVSAPTFAHGSGDYVVADPVESANNASASGYINYEHAVLVDETGVASIVGDNYDRSPRYR